MKLETRNQRLGRVSCFKSSRRPESQRLSAREAANPQNQFMTQNQRLEKTSDI